MPRFPLYVYALLPLAAIAADPPSRRHLYPVPEIDDACVQRCFSAHELCLLGVRRDAGLCGDERRLCVERCDPQMMNSVLTGTVEDRYPRADRDRD
jgi:hypothetical protein